LEPSDKLRSFDNQTFAKNFGLDKRTASYFADVEMTRTMQIERIVNKNTYCIKNTTFTEVAKNSHKETGAITARFNTFYAGA
tara:strand:+ start:17 stop:262 length:246 start_codon:yes stop_codon:yes gene_type:complete